MKIAVCVKQVPDSEAQMRIRSDGRWIEEEKEPILNENDLFAIEEAIALGERSDGEVVVFTVGPDTATKDLRKALAMGAHRAVHLKDEAFLGGDASSTGRALAAAIAREDFHLVLTGSQSDDAGHGATGSIIAGYLGWAHAWLVMGVTPEEGGATALVVREMEGGMNENLRLPLPAVLEVQAGINQPRYAALKGIMQAKRKPIEEPTPADLGLEPDEVGRAGAAVEIVSIAFPESGEGAQMIEGDAETAARTLVDKLRNEARVL